jgi:hypothetical protein
MNRIGKSQFDTKTQNNETFSSVHWTGCDEMIFFAEKSFRFWTLLRQKKFVAKNHFIQTNTKNQCS